MGLSVYNLAVDILGLGDKGLTGLLLKPVAYLVGLLSEIGVLLRALELGIHFFDQFTDDLILEVC